MVVGAFAEERDTIIIGAGPGGYVAAIRAAQMGQKVTIVERDYLGGVCLNVGCIPSKALIEAGHNYQTALHSDYQGITATDVKVDFTKVQDWKDNQVVAKMTSGVEYLLKKNKVEIIMGEAFILNDKEINVSLNDGTSQLYSYNNLIIATGSTPIELPTFKWSKRVIDSTGALALEEIPEKLTVIGAGVIGTELGTAYANLGTEVTFLEGSGQILPTFEKDVVRPVQKGLEDKGAKIVTNAFAKEAIETEDGVTVKYEVDGKAEEVTSDYVLVSVGRYANTRDIGLEGLGVKTTERGLIEVDEQGRTNIKNIFAIGDIVAGAALAHKASYEAKIAAEAISGKSVAVDYKAMPAIAYTEPEVATAGYTKAEAKEAGLDVKTTKFLFSGNGRAVSMNQAEGFVRLVTTKDDNTIVGAQIVGPNASEVLTETVVAIEAGMNAEDIALTVHGHPTLSEAVMDAAEAVLGLPIHM